ncbi:hypothetical protein T09_3766, partial [Trichinella sp. T9]
LTGWNLRERNSTSCWISASYDHLAAVGRHRSTWFQRSNRTPGAHVEIIDASTT